MSDLKARFEAAIAAVKKLDEDPGNDAKLQLYALYKQGSEGDIAGKRPGFTDMIGRAKFDAWAKVKGLTKDDAMKQYIALVKSLGGVGAGSSGPIGAAAAPVVTFPSLISLRRAASRAPHRRPGTGGPAVLPPPARSAP
jgi:diazepam-binding inhibitor (GABA receptor modulating acyl-CoA-binding protein)